MREVTRTVVLDGGMQALRLRAMRLVICAPGQEPREETLRARRVRLGTDPDGDLVLRGDPLVSRRHALITVDAGGYRLQDLDSKNGILVGDMRVRDVDLRPGLTFRVGATALTFELTDDEVEVPISARGRFGDLIGSAEVMREVFALLERAAPSAATVLVEGESGTGKELVAEALHAQSPRRDKPLVVFDCSALSPDLVESELFGHVKGAYTGAHTDRKGAFEAADGGTLFLDEIGELPLELQPKLLRALEKRQVRRVGENTYRPADVRVVAATNRRLAALVSAGLFREDLYYRLAVLRVELPPLRERPEDIPLLVEHFLARLRTTPDAGVPTVSYGTMEKLKKHRWPGNVRELRNFVERAAILSTGGEVETRFLRLTDRLEPAASPDEREESLVQWSSDQPFKEAKQALIDRFERLYWRRQLDLTGGNISEAARRAGVHRKSLEYILRKLELGAVDGEDAEGTC